MWAKNSYWFGNAENCRFINCHSENYGGALAVGKAINCYFEKCSSHKDGGAISTTDAVNCVFKECKSYSDGGAMDRGTAKNCQFINCHADKYGGALYGVKHVSCKFSKNSASWKGKNVQNFVSLKKVKVKKSAGKLVLTAKIIRHLGYKVIFKFNGKTYKSKVITKRDTPAKVTIKLSALKKLKVGKKIKYSATYLADTVEHTVKVKK